MDSVAELKFSECSFRAETDFASDYNLIGMTNLLNPSMRASL